LQRLQAKIDAGQKSAPEPEECAPAMDRGQTGEPLDIEEAVTALQEGDVAARYEVVKMLTVSSDPRAVELLLAILKDRNRYMRQAVVEALAQIGDPRAVEPLIAALRDRSRHVRLAAAEALRTINDPLAVEALIAAMRSGDNDLRSIAIEALAEIGEPAIKPLIAILQGRNKDARQATAEVLSKIGQLAVEWVVPILEHWDRQVRKTAADILDEIGWQPRDSDAAYWVAKAEWDKCVEIGQPAIKPLVAVLQDLDNDVRQAAVKTLDKIGDSSALEPLVAVLKDRDSSVRKAAVEAIVGLGQPAVEPLVVALQEWNSHRIRQRIADVLDELGWLPGEDEIGATYWIAKSDWDRCVAMGALAIEPLVATLRDRDNGVRWAAAEMLDQLGWRPGMDEIGATYWIAKSDWNRCIRIGEPAIKPLVEALWNSESWVQQGAAGALERIGTPEAMAAVEEWQKTKNR